MSEYPYQNLPVDWQAWADELTPESHPIPDWVMMILIIGLSWLIPAIIIVASWHWLVS